MNSFKSFQIKEPERGFEGKKIKISKIMNLEITVLDFKLEDSKIEEFRAKGTKKCLHMQILLNDEKRVVFTSASYLIDVIQQIPKEGFPFTTTIKEENERFIFS
jgi:hypothetical protein